MRITFAYYLVLLYTVAICKPILPLVHDFIAHTFWAVEHIELVHHNHGKNHVHYELKKAAAPENTETASLVSEPVSCHLLTPDTYSFCRQAIVTPQQFTGRCCIRSRFLETHTPPPKA